MVEAIARRVVELLALETAEATRGGLIDAAALARELGVERDWVYEHAGQLGAIRLGGPRGRLRFDLEVVREKLGGAEPGSWRPPRRRPRRSTATSNVARPSRRRPIRSTLTAKTGREAPKGSRPGPAR